MHGVEISYYKKLFQTVENIMQLIKKDDISQYLLFLENIFPYMEKYHYQKGMAEIIQELKQLIKTDNHGTASDRALLLDYQAAMEAKPQISNYAALLAEIQETERAISSLQKLARIIKEYNSDHCLDYAQVQESMGNICLITANISQARTHFKKALKIYENIWSDEPELIDAKYQVIQELYSQVGFSIGKRLSDFLAK